MKNFCLKKGGYIAWYQDLWPKSAKKGVGLSMIGTEINMIQTWHQCFFFPWKSHFLPWKFLQLLPWKIQCVREKSWKSTPKNQKCPWKFWKNLTWISDFYTWKKKMHAWKRKSGREKSGESRWMYLFLRTFFNFVTNEAARHDPDHAVHGLLR